MNKNSKTFIIYTAFFNLAPGIYPDKAAQIALLLTKKVRIPDKYSDIVKVFSEKNALVLPKCTKLNEYAIDLENGKQPPYGLIYSLGLVELETLKTYIKTHLKTGFIRPFKSPTVAPILFDKKLEGSLCLCIDYQSLNNPTIKN